MASQKKEESKEAGTSSPPPADVEASRRHFLKIGLTAGVVLVVLGAAGVARSLISPSNPPQAQAVQPPAPPETTTVTVTVGSSSGSASASSSASTSSTSTSSSPFPRVLAANIKDVSETTPVFFNYPLEETPPGAEAPSFTSTFGVSSRG